MVENDLLNRVMTQIAALAGTAHVDLETKARRLHGASTELLEEGHRKVREGQIDGKEIGNYLAAASYLEARAAYYMAEVACRTTLSAIGVKR
ncbi:hypothetical protein HYS48_01830 [Candidatus Woesearchaeota archaeon]|nr:hypothetical protein [Candidatus Woesearchaeota archaeon]